MLNIDQLKTNPNAQVVISFGGVPLSCLLIDDMTIDGQAEYNNPLFSAQQQQLNETANKIKTGYGAATSAFTGKPQFLPSVTTTTLEQSVNAWTGTSKPIFNLRLVFVAFREEDDIKIPISRLYETVYPGSTTGPTKGNFLKAPLGYQAAGLSARGTVAVQVGTWFFATQQNMRSVSFTFSKQTLQSGKPLFAQGSISFEPFRAITIYDMKRYLRV